MNDEEIYDSGFYEGLAVAWQHMHDQVLGQRIDFLKALKALAVLRDTARREFERHATEEVHCICREDEVNIYCTSCF